MRLIADIVAFTVNEIPRWNPINICSYHLQEAGATRFRRSPSRSPRDRRPRRGRTGARSPRGLPEGLRPDLLLRQRRRPLHRRAREAARDGRDVGVDRAEPLRVDRPELTTELRGQQATDQTEETNQMQQAPRSALLGRS